LGGIRQGQFALNGTPMGRATAAASAGYPGRLVIGSIGLPPLSGTPPPFDEPSRSNVSEILFYNRVLSDMERREVSNYLAEKWGLPRPFQRHYASQSVRYTGGDEGEGLDFTGNFLYALTANAFATDTIGDATFTDIANTSGVAFNSEFHIQNWLSPYYGDSDADFALANVTNSIRWTDPINGENTINDHTTILTGLTPGNVYKVQFIFNELCCGRHFGIQADGSPIRRDFEEAAIIGNQWNVSPSAGSALIYQFQATNDTVTFTLVANDLNVADRNPILNALTMEDLGAGGEASIGSITGVDSLDLSGMFLYALDFGNSHSLQGSGPRTIAGLTFEPAETATGVYTYADNVLYYNQPNFAAFGSNHPDDFVLEDVLATIRYEGTTGDEDAVAVDLMGLTPGLEYKLQLMFSDANASNRFFDIVVNDVLVWNDFSVGSVTGGDPLMGAYFTYQFIADRTELNVLLHGAAYASDVNPLVSALTLEVIPEPGAVSLMIVGLAGILGSRRRR
jgi:hypothetical protein